MDTERIAMLARALSHPARVQLVELLSRQSACTGAEVFSEMPLAQSTVSEHLRVLQEAGVVTSSAVGTGRVYCLTQSALRDLADAVAGLAHAATSCDTGACGVDTQGVGCDD